MNNFINQILNKDRNIRKKGLISLSSTDFNFLSKEDINTLYSQLEKIIEHDEPDITFFARKVKLYLEEFMEKNNINLRGDPVNELYKKKADELIVLLNTEEKLIRINTIYALAKTGCSEEHIKALELFAEKAPEDEASLAIDSIMAIKKFIKEKEEKKKEREETRITTLNLLNNSKQEKMKKKYRPEKPSVNKYNSKPRNIYIILSSAFIILFLSTVFIYFSFLFNPYSYIPENSELIFISKYRLNPVIAYRNETSTEIIKLKFTFKGWIIEKF